MKKGHIFRRLALGLALAALVVLVSSEGALAHASLVRADPAPGSQLATSPQRVSLWFSEPIEPKFSQIQVLDSAGTRVDNGDSARYGSDPRALSVSVRPLSQGVYTVA